MSHHTFRTYLIGFILSVILTLCAFQSVMHHAFPTETLLILLAVLSLVQMIVQVLCFIRLNANTVEGRWNLICFLFTLFITVVIVGGSLWIMYNLNYNMSH